MKNNKRYLTHQSALLRDFIQQRLDLGDVDEWDIVNKKISELRPNPKTYYLDLELINQDLFTLTMKILYVEKFSCDYNQLTKLPELPVCQFLHCSNNLLTTFPKLSVDKHLILSDFKEHLNNCRNPLMLSFFYLLTKIKQKFNLLLRKCLTNF